MAKKGNAWVAPRGGGYSAVSANKKGGTVRPKPPKGRAAVSTPTKSSNKGEIRNG